MKITWFNTASILIESETTKILFDPFTGMNVRKEKTSAQEYAAIGADAIFVTHGHFDHIMHIPEIMSRDASASCYCTQTPKATLVKKGVPESRINIISPEDTLTIGDIKITAKQGRHIQNDKEYLKVIYLRDTINWPMFYRLWYLYKTMPENGEILIYEIECEGKTITLLGSLGIDENTVYTPNPDIMIFPYAGNLSIAKEGRPILERINPSRIIFDHFDNSFPPMTFTMNVGGYAKLLEKTNPEIKTIIPHGKISILL